MFLLISTYVFVSPKHKFYYAALKDMARNISVSVLDVSFLCKAMKSENDRPTPTETMAIKFDCSFYTYVISAIWYSW